MSLLLLLSNEKLTTSPIAGVAIRTSSAGTTKVSPVALEYFKIQNKTRKGKRRDEAKIRSGLARTI